MNFPFPNPNPELIYVIFVFSDEKRFWGEDAGSEEIRAQISFGGDVSYSVDESAVQIVQNGRVEVVDDQFVQLLGQKNCVVSTFQNSLK